MALIHLGYTVQDDDGDKSTVTVKIPTASWTLANIVEFSDDFVELLDNTTDGQIVEANCVISLALPGGLKASPVANSEVQKGGLIAFTASGTPYRYSVRVPALVPAKFVGNEVNLADSDVEALTDAYVDGLAVTGGTMQPSDEYENDLASVISGVKSFRRK